MKLRPIILVIACLLCSPAWAQPTVTCSAISGLCESFDVAQAQVRTDALSPVVLDQGASIPQDIVNATGPVSSDTTISVGTLAGQFLTWIAAAFSVPVGSALTYWLVKLAQRAGVQMTADMSEKLQGIIVNGLNAGAAANAERMRGQNPVLIKSAIVADAVRYAQSHGADTIKALGLDPQSGEAVQAIKARIETAITDPTVPTPKVLDPPATPQYPANGR